MKSLDGVESRYDHPIKIGEDVFWVGAFDMTSKTHFNAYLIIDENEAVLIDGGSRSGFALVIMKILKSGIVPANIIALIFQNYNSSCTGSVFHLQKIIDRKDMVIISDHNIHMFMKHDCNPDPLISLESINFEFHFSSGRCLTFVKIPFAHSSGSFATFDCKSNILFTGDLFGSYTSPWDLFLKLIPECHACVDQTECPKGRNYCPVADMAEFHRHFMASERALKYALDRIASLPFTCIAPQHGSIIRNPEDIVFTCELLSTLKSVGIDGIIGEKSFFELGDIGPIQARLLRSQ